MVSSSADIGKLLYYKHMPYPKSSMDGPPHGSHLIPPPLVINGMTYLDDHGDTMSGYSTSRCVCSILYSAESSQGRESKVCYLQLQLLSLSSRAGMYGPCPSNHLPISLSFVIYWQAVRSSSITGEYPVRMLPVCKGYIIIMMGNLVHFVQTVCQFYQCYKVLDRVVRE